MKKKIIVTKTTKAAKKKELARAEGEQCFWVHKGPILSDLRGLALALRDGITDEQFAHHVGKERNDFAAWVEAVLRDKKTADNLRKTKVRKGAADAVLRSLKSYH